jgi:hypothetical protein
MNPQIARFARRSELSISFFGFGLICFSLFAVILPLAAQDVLAQHHYTHRTISLTHLLVLGWITSTIMGALYQISPVLAARPLHSRKLGWVTLGLHVCGVAGMVVCFWKWELRCLLWSGSFVSLGLSLFIYNILRTLRRTEANGLIVSHLFSGIVYLVLTFLAGQYLMHDKVMEFSPFHVLSAIHAHAHLAVIGFFFMIIIGVSYELIPMFTLSSIQNPLRARGILWSLNLLLPLLFAAILMQSSWLPWIALGIAFMIVMWMVEIFFIFRSRRRISLDAPLFFTRGAAAQLVCACLLGVWLAIPGESTMFRAQLQTSYGILALIGFVSLFTISLLYKLIPFLVWYQIYPPLVGRQPVPQLHDLYSRPLAKAGMGMLGTGAWMVAITAAFGHVLPLEWLQAAAVWLGIGVLLNAVNLFLPMVRLVLATRIFQPTTSIPREA